MPASASAGPRSSPEDQTMKWRELLDQWSLSSLKINVGVLNAEFMAIKKSDLYSSLWASCDELRGGMDASQYKDYVLFMLFIKYISDKYADSTTSRRRWSSRPGASFKDMVALKGKPTSATRSTPRSSSR
jgi:hypothetical protein